MKTLIRCGALLMVSSIAMAQTPPWTVTLRQTLDPLPIGMCGAVHLTLLDPATRDVPRNPQGNRITMADFDMTVSGGASAAGHQIDAYHFAACGCQGGAAGSSATVTARYPAASLPVANRVRGVSIQQTTTFTLALPKGATNPPSCITLAAGTASSGAVGGAAAGSGAQGGAAAAAGLGAATAGAGAAGAAGAPQMAGAGAGGTAAAGAAGNTSTGGGAKGEVAAASGAGAAGAPQSAGGGAAGTAAAGAAGSGNTRVGGGAQGGAATGAPIPAMVPVNPSGFIATQGAPGEVLLSWNPVAAAQFYVVFGPGLTPGGQRVDQGAGTAFPQGTNKITLPASNVPGGMQEWAVASYYPDNVTTPGSAFSRVSLNVTVPATAAAPPASSPTSAPAAPATLPSPPPMIANTYLVTITGLRAYQASMDDLLSRDGIGDEVYVAAYVRNYDRRSDQLASAGIRISAVHGDVTKGGSQRMQAGTKSGTGGIHDGDMIPDGGFLAARMVPAQNTTFPLRIFEGTLADGVDTLLISPSIWEQDDTNAYFLQWQQNQATLNQSLWAKQGVHDEISQRTFKPLKFGMSAHDSLTGATSVVHFFTDAMIMFGGGGVPIIGLIKASADRPLGLHENGRDQTALPNHVIVLTREIIEAALARPALGPVPSPVANGFPGQGLLSTPAIARVGVIATKPGIMVLQFEDRNVSGMLAFPERPAIYQMYIQVERIP